MTNPQYSPGDLVRVVDSTFHVVEASVTKSEELVGKICEVKYPGGDGIVSVWTPDKSDFWYFKLTDLEPATPPDEIEQHGVTYVRKDRVAETKL